MYCYCTGWLLPQSDYQIAWQCKNPDTEHHAHAKCTRSSWCWAWVSLMDRTWQDILFDKVKGVLRQFRSKIWSRVAAESIIAVSRVPEAHLRDLQLPLQLHLGSRRSFSRDWQPLYFGSIKSCKSSNAKDHRPAATVVMRLSIACTVFLKAHSLNCTLEDTRLSFQSGMEHPLGWTRTEAISGKSFSTELPPSHHSSPLQQ